jgi:HlyD family secretion protein
MTRIGARGTTIVKGFAADPVPEDGADTALRSAVLSGIAIVGLLCAGVFGWGLFAHLDSAVVADGSIVADSHTKTVQNLEGGILREILVKNGDRVRTGQVLAYLDSTQADSELAQLTNQYWTASARVVRLQTELDDKRALEFPDALTEAGSDTVVAETLRTQTRTFESRWHAYDSQVAVIQRRIDQQREEISAARVSIASNNDQKALTEKELAAAQSLYDKGLSTLPRVLALRRAIADLDGKIGDRRGDIGKATQAIAGAEAELAAARDMRLADIGKELQEAMSLQADLDQKLTAARDVQKRRAITAPQDGIVSDIKVFTLGGVLGPGQPILDIVPSNDSLVVDAKIKPADIESVRENLPAKVWFTAYKRTQVPPVTGRVVTVSADRLEDKRTGEPYFIARIAVDAGELKRLETVKLHPGMPAEVSVIVEARRAITYFIEPITARLDRSFNEQ